MGGTAGSYQGRWGKNVEKGKDSESFGERDSIGDGDYLKVGWEWSWQKWLLVTGMNNEMGSDLTHVWTWKICWWSSLGGKKNRGSFLDLLSLRYLWEIHVDTVRATLKHWPFSLQQDGTPSAWLLPLPLNKFAAGLRNLFKVVLPVTIPKWRKLALETKRTFYLRSRR